MSFHEIEGQSNDLLPSKNYCADQTEPTGVYAAHAVSGFSRQSKIDQICQSVSSRIAFGDHVTQTDGSSFLDTAVAVIEVVHGLRLRRDDHQFVNADL
jgi:hypothetical protein